MLMVGDAHPTWLESDPIDAVRKLTASYVLVEGIMPMRSNLLIIVVSLFLFAEPSFGREFRGSKWGASLDDVIQNEKTDRYRKYSHGANTYLDFWKKVYGYTAHINYEFMGNRLVRGIYSFNERFKNNEKHVDIYYDIKAQLIKKYGQPAFERIVSRENRNSLRKKVFKGNLRGMGNAIAKEKIVARCVWRRKDEEILLKIEAGTVPIHTLVMFTSKKDQKELHRELERQEIRGEGV